jgi:hypothetical protein
MHAASETCAEQDSEESRGEAKLRSEGGAYQRASASNGGEVVAK